MTEVTSPAVSDATSREAYPASADSSTGNSTVDDSKTGALDSGALDSGALAAVSPAPVATGCCSDHSHQAVHSDHAAATPNLPISSGLPIAQDCCSTAGGCASGQSTAEDDSVVDDTALIEALRDVIDPELMINIVDLGLVYSINHTDRKVNVEMTLTSPACPAGPQIIMQSKLALEKLPGVDSAEIKLTMSPPWTPARMTDEARDHLGIF